MEEKKYDILGQEIKIGDEVMYMEIKHRDFIRGIIISLAPKSALISTEKTYIAGRRQFYTQIINITAFEKLREGKL